MMMTVPEAVEFCRNIDKELPARFIFGDLVFKVLYDDDGGKYLYVVDCAKSVPDSLIYLFVSAHVDGGFLEIMYQNASKVGTEEFLFTSVPLKVVA